MNEDTMSKLDRKRPEKTERRKQLESQILEIFKESVDGIGKYDIKRKLILLDKDLAISINTVKRIVGEFIADGIIECVNPNESTKLKFRLTSKHDDSVESTKLGIEFEVNNFSKKEAKDD